MAVISKSGVHNTISQDVDGNGWSGRFHRLMISNACIFKSTAFSEWYAERIQPWLQCVFVCPPQSLVHDWLR